MNACACPSCGADLVFHGEAEIIGSVDAANDPRGESRLDMMITCANCDTDFNVFVAVSELVLIVDEDAA